jgi:GT2 family glycosyltransferase
MGSDCKLILVDNNSNCGQEELESICAGLDVELRVNSQNLGFAGAHNVLFAEFPQSHFLLINPDLVIEPNSLEAMLRYMNQDPKRGVVGARLWKVSQSDYLAGIFKKETLDSVGIQTDIWGRATDISNPQFATTGERDAVTGAMMLLRSELLQDLKQNQGECFDEEFFAYSEDHDLCLRAKKLGYKIEMFDQAEAFHIRAGAGGIRKKNVNPRIVRKAIVNKNILLIKHYTIANLALSLLPVLFYESLRYGYILLRSPQVGLWPWDFLKRLPSALKKRRRIYNS